MVLLREREPRPRRDDQPVHEVGAPARGSGAAAAPAVTATPRGAAAERGDALAVVLQSAVLQRWPLALPPVKRGSVQPWLVDTHGQGGEFIKGWIDNAVETYNRGAIDALIRQLKGSTDPCDTFLVDYARAALRRIKPWVVFGLDGRKASEIESALKQGYRRFDCAETYGNTELLAAAVKRCGLPRDSYEVLYKFDLRTGEDDRALGARLQSVCALFAGRVDCLVIHNLDVDWTRIAAGWTVLADFKRRGLARRIGIGNVRARHGPLLEQLAKVARIDVIENTIHSVLLDENVRALVRESGAELFVYNVMTAAKAIELTTAAQITDLISMLDASPTMIVSSSQGERNVGNLREFGSNPFLVPPDLDAEEDLTTGSKLFAWKQTQLAKGATNEEIELSTPLRSFLSSLMGEGAVAARSEFRSLGQHNRLAIVHWLHTRHGIAPAELMDAAVPRRVGLKPRFAGMPLTDVLLALLGTKNCDWKWSIELVQLLLASVEDWTSFLSLAAEEITDG